MYRGVLIMFENERHILINLVATLAEESSEAIASITSWTEAGDLPNNPARLEQVKADMTASSRTVAEKVASRMEYIRLISDASAQKTSTRSRLLKALNHLMLPGCLNFVRLMLEANAEKNKHLSLI
jgi:hypothetical protein